MTTYLISVGYSLSWITTVRILSSIIELAPTALVPWMILSLSQDTTDPLGPLARIGIWGLGSQISCLVLPTIVMLFLHHVDTDPASFSPDPALTAAFFAFLTLSRFGAWTHNLIAQNIVQITIPVESRAQFSGVEMAFVSAAEIARWSCGAVWPQPQQFPVLSTTSFCVVVFSYMLFGTWAGRRRERDLRCASFGADG